MNLKIERIKKGLTQEQLSKKADVCRLTISNIENGKVNIKNIQLGVLIRLARALESDIETLFLNEN